MTNKSVDILIKARDEASKKFNKIGRSGQRMGKLLAGIGGAVGAYIGIRQLVRLTRDSVQAFAEQEMAVRHLTDALALLNQESQVPEMKAFAAEIQKLTTIGDETTIELMSMGAAMGKLSGDSLKGATTAAIGLSKAYKIDLTAAMRLVARAAQGDTTTLARYGIKLEEGLTTQQKFNQILRIGADNFALAQGETNTYRGVVQQLSNSWGDAKEKLGAYIANTPGLIKGFKTAQVVIENFGTVMKLTWTSAALGMVGFWEDMKHFFGTVVPAYTSWFFENWKNVLTNMWEASKSIFGNMYTNITEFFKAVWSWLHGDGFDFTWTGLLDGFESTLAELPKIADRQLSDLEKELGNEAAGYYAALAQKLDEKMNPGTVNVADLISGAAPDQVAGTAAAAAKNKTVAAVEARFLTGSSRTADHAKVTADASRRQVALLERIAKREDTLDGIKRAILGQSSLKQASIA